MRAGILTTFSFILISTASFCQLQFETGAPLFPSVERWYDAMFDKSQIDILSSLDQPKNQPYQFAVSKEVFLTPENSGFVVRNQGEVIWVMPVTSKDALSLNVILAPFDLPSGAYLYVYDDNHEVIRGAYTNKSGNSYGILPLLPVPGDKLVIECHFKGNSIPANVIAVKQISHDFAGFFGLTDNKDENFGRSGYCEPDIICFSDSSYSLMSNSVCRLVVDGTRLCTGTLINKTGKDYKPYVLTANHCIQNSYDAASTIFVFNYKSPWCNGPDQYNIHSISGSLLRAGNTDIDFALLELSSFPSLVFRPYLAGWDITPTTPSNTYAIHHPQGDVMKISRDNDAPVQASFPISGYEDNSFWKILRWDSGTTEGGSSGCSLFDQNNRVRGTLTGGLADCSSPEDDYFAMLNVMFYLSDNPSRNLRPWLDPSGSGATLTNGRDPYEYNLQNSDTLSNMPDNDPGTTDEYLAPDFGYSTGTNSDSLISYAEYVPFPGEGEIAWVYLNIAESSFLLNSDSVRIFIWDDGSVPGTVLASKRVRLENVLDNKTYEVDFGRTVKVNGPFYAGYRVYYKGISGSPQAQFAVKHSEPYISETLNTAWFHDGTLWHPFTQHPSFPMSVSLDIKVIIVDDSVLYPEYYVPPSDNNLTVHPNPFSESISFTVNAEFTNTYVTLYNNAGAVVSATQYRNVFPGTVTIDLPYLSPGAYHFKLINDKSSYYGTIIKIDTP